MPRDTGGTYTLPAGNPVVSGTIIASTWANPTMNDLGNEITDSLSRTGNGSMLAPLKHIDGSVGGPSQTFINDPTVGRYLAGAGDMRDAIAGADIAVYTAAGVEFTVPLTTVDIATTGAITATDNITAYLTSDERLKSNITAIESPLAKVETLRAVTYDKVIDKGTGRTHFETGLIAQDVAKVTRDLVHTNADGYLVIKTGGLELTALLVGAIKELSAKVAALEGK